MRFSPRRPCCKTLAKFVDRRQNTVYEGLGASVKRLERCEGTAMTTPYQAFSSAVSSSPSTIFLRLPKAAHLPYAPDGATITYGEAGKRIEELRLRYALVGYGHGATVALLVENRPAFFLHW